MILMEVCNILESKICHCIDANILGNETPSLTGAGTIVSLRVWAAAAAVWDERRSAAPFGVAQLKRVVDKHFHRDTVPELPEGVPGEHRQASFAQAGARRGPKSVKFDLAHLLPHEMKTPWRRGLRGFSATFAMAFYMSFFHQWENPNDEFGISRNVFMPIREFYWRKKKEFGH